MRFSQMPPALSSERPERSSRRSFLGKTVGALVGAGLLPLAGRAAPSPVGGEAPAAPEGPLRVGTAKADVTPSLDVPLWGFSARKGPAEAVYLPLFVRAMTFNDGANKVALISGEYLYWSREVVERLRARLAEAHGFRPDQIVLNATHTHCGPRLSHAPYADQLVERTVEAVGQCLAGEQPARLYFGRGRSDVGVSRRGIHENGYVYWAINPYGAVDPEVIVLKAVDAGGRPLGACMNYACHPTVIADKLFGGDFAGYAMHYVEQQLGDVPVLFLQGTGGDIKPNHPREDNPIRFSYDGGPERCAYFGRKLADAVVEVLSAPMQEISGAVRTSLETVELPLLERVIEEEGAAPFAGSRRRMVRLAKLMLAAMDEQGRYRETRPCEVYLVRIGDAFVHVGLNGEICVPIGLRIKGQQLGRPVMVTGYTGPSIGYVPGKDQIPAKGYEARVPYSPEAEDHIVAHVMERIYGTA